MTSRHPSQARDVFTVTRHGEGWAVEHDGQISGESGTKDEARATAHKLARAAHDAGRPCQVTISDETGFFPSANAFMR
jgi:hypothetical protein